MLSHTIPRNDMRVEPARFGLLRLPRPAMVRLCITLATTLMVNALLPWSWSIVCVHLCGPQPKRAKAHSVTFPETSAVTGECHSVSGV